MVFSAVPGGTVTRIEVFRCRLVPTALVLLLAFAVIRFIWFPAVHFSLAGIGNLVLVMAGVNLVIGPGLTTIVYRPGKRGLLADVLVIVVLELGALGLGMHAIFQRQPVYTVFAVDRFEVVARSEVRPGDVPHPELQTKPGHAPRLVYAEMPADPGEYDRLLDAVLLGGEPDIDRRPGYWRAYAAGVAVVRDKSQPLADLLADGDPRADAVMRWLRGNTGQVADYAYLPIRGRSGDAAMILHADIGYPVDILRIDPW